uniref:U-box domain-containing protein n=1 Tax=Anthurium amnicola TaxID=1678845 RepID=A0A1D1YH80_9ARAE
MAAVAEEKGIDIPPYFLCPISLQIMRDPVTLPTGITYDRDDIEKWLFPAGKAKAAPTCPVTKQPIIPGADLTPNHTLRRLIQAWCVANASHGVERFPTPRAPVDRSHVEHLLNQAREPATQLGALRKLRSVAAESERNRRCVEATGAPDILVSVIRSCGSPAPCEEDDRVESTSCGSGGDAEEEALCILYSLQISQQGFCDLIVRNSDLVELLTAVLQRSSYQSRAYATFLLRSVFEAVSPVRLLVLKAELFQELVKVVTDQISYKTTKTALRILAQVCPWGRNRIKAAEAGGVPVLVELLLDATEKWVCEMALVVLDQLCGCAEGRAELLSHAAGLAVVSKKILRVSLPATERAVRVIAAVSKSSATPAVLQEMLKVGVVTKLCLLLQVDCGNKTKERAKEVLRLHSRTWKCSPCIPPQLLASYPSLL